MYDAKVLEVVIASPSDVEEERNICERVLYEWNNIHSKENGISLQPRRWENSIYSAVGKPPQNSINKQIIDDADLLIAIFWTKLGNPTEQYESGTVEEIERHIAHGKDAMIFFSNATVKPNVIDNNQYARLQAFKDWCKTNSLFVEYDTCQEFKDKAGNNISRYINAMKQKILNEGEAISLNETKYSQTKQDAVDFLCALRDKSDSVSPVETANTFLQDIGLFRARRLSPFLVHEKLLEILPRTDGQFFIRCMSGLSFLQKEDIDILLQEVKNGRCDAYLIA